MDRDDNTSEDDTTAREQLLEEIAIETENLTPHQRRLVAAKIEVLKSDPPPLKTE